MLFLNLDILYSIVEQVARSDSKSSREILLSLAPVCKAFNESIRAHLFATVHWPHPNKHDEEAGLLFFPVVLWPFFRTFHLDWPDHWPDTTPPKWGEKPGLSVYYPKHLDKLEDALPNMLNVHTFQLTCPFDPPTKLLRAIVGCSNIKNLKITDTPLYTTILPTMPSTFMLDSLTLTSVGEAARLGEAPYEKRFQNITYFMRGYRKKYFDFSDAALMGRVFAAQRFVSSFCRPETLRYFVFSAVFMSVDEFSNVDVNWPLLEKLVLTGPPPLQEPSMSRLVARMPRLVDLRILLSTLARSNTTQRPFTLVSPPAPVDPTASPTHTEDLNAYMQLTSLALSNAYNSQGVLRYTPQLARLAMCAIISPPRMSIALRRNEIEDLLSDLKAGGGNLSLRHIRLISEEELDAKLFAKLGMMCPTLEIVEVERCGYQDAHDDTDWPDWGDAFAEYKCLRNLRLAMPFLGCEELDHEHEHRDRVNPACVRAFRKPFAEYLATRVPTLQHVGLEYRWRSMHRYEDRWLDFDIVRLRNGGVTLNELGPTWYRFPEVYDPEPLYD